MASDDALAARKAALRQGYARHGRARSLAILALLPVMLLVAGLAVANGSADISLADIARAMAARLSPGPVARSAEDTIIWNLRLPRVLMGLCAGMALGSAGAAMQIVLRNPLADPYMLGIASAAGFGASLAIVLGVGLGSGSYLIVGNAFVFSILSSLLILALSGRRNASPERMVLTGLAMLFFFQAMTTMVQYFGNAEAVKAAVFWTVGDLGKADWTKLAVAGPVSLAGTAYLSLKSGDLNVLNAGDASAKSLGVDVGRTRTAVMLASALMVATIVSFTGTIGFVGLVSPHLVRLVIGSDNRRLIPGAALVGGTMLVVSDLVARTVASPMVLPVGSVTAFLGVPLFLYLIMKNKGGTL